MGNGQDPGGSSQKEQVTGTGSLNADVIEAEDVLSGAEPWDPIETKIVIGSFMTAAILLVLFAILIHKYVLN
jgi:hypothetical protein